MSKSTVCFMKYIILSLVVVGLLSQCAPSTENRALPPATGRSGDLIILMDSLQWKGELGEEVRSIFSSEVAGLPRSEQHFNVIWVHPNKKIKLLTQIRNLVYVFTLDQQSPGTRVITENLSAETVRNIESDTSFYLVSKQDEYSRGQEILYLFGNTADQLRAHLKRDGDKIRDRFNMIERNRSLEAFKRVTSTRHHSQLLADAFGLNVSLPAGFQLAQQERDFIWFRSPETEIDRNFFIARKPYESEYQLLPDSMMAWRESICRNYIFEDPDRPETYITLERDVPYNPLRARQVSLNGKFAMEVRGLWRTNNRTMGGPFISYAFVNEAGNELYYVEGFIYSPGKPQRELIREMEAIAYSLTPVTPKQ